MDFEPTHIIQPKSGYWETTHYPIGGCFRRAGEQGLPVKMVAESKFVRGYGHLTEFVTAEGDKLFAGHFTAIATA